jgi:hypothetical protein
VGVTGELRVRLPQANGKEASEIKMRSSNKFFTSTPKDLSEPLKHAGSMPPKSMITPAFFGVGQNLEGPIR